MPAFTFLSVLVSLVASLGLARSAYSAGWSFAGVPLSPGSTVSANVPLSDLEKSYVAEGGNTVPPYTVAVLAVPPGFDPKKSWPVLVAFSSSDNRRQNRDALEFHYRRVALAEGWVVLAGDGPAPASRADSTGWRAGHTLAALDALHRSFPGSTQWPVACAGHSGGSKRASYISPLLALAGNRIIGVFVSGITQEGLPKQQPPSEAGRTNYFTPQVSSVCCESIAEGYRRFHPGSSFLRTPIFISTGRADQIATLEQQTIVQESLRRAGFTNIRHRVWDGGHFVRQSHVQEALRWFRTGS
jgi:surfactin synthase thioesterase subunit